MRKGFVYPGLAGSLLLLILASAAAAQMCKGERGSGYDPLKTPFFGDLHSHTSWSFDAVTIGTTTTPVEAYEFAKGEEIPLASYSGHLPRSRRLSRPLDFLAVTDHSEYFGEVRMCLPCGTDGRPSPGSVGPVEVPGDCATTAPASLACTSMQNTVFGLRDGSPLQPEDPNEYEGWAFLTWGVPLLIPDPDRFAFCPNADPDCDAVAASVWEEVRDNANDANQPCHFTAFVGYEWSSQPKGRNHHRNVIFKNDQVPSVAFSVFETDGAGYNVNDKPGSTLPADGAPELWRLLEEKCVNAAGDCDALAIPHNANFGGGTILPIFDADAQDDRERQRYFERLMEIHQVKGNSECRTGVGTNDEDCQFELMSKLFLLEVGDMKRARGPVNYQDDSGDPDSDPYLSAEDQGYSQLPEAFGANTTQTTGGTYNSFQREILKAGLWLAQDDEYAGENPYKLGTVGGTDTHASTAGATEEIGYEGHHNLEDATPELRLSLETEVGGRDVPADPKHTFLEMNPGALTAVWATENTRDAIFDGMKGRETYATSGNRPTVRFFGSWTDSEGAYQAELCNGSADEFATAGYRTDEAGNPLSVPMGSDLPAVRPEGSKPIFAIRAARDPREDLASGLQRLQVVKGWVDDGIPQETVLTVAFHGTDGAPDHSQYVNADTCQIADPGEADLCTVWTDVDFEEEHDAFYYVRVLESPTCRWSTRQCIELAKRARVTPQDHPCWESLTTPALTNNDAKDGITVPLTIQERAWSSPIWYQSGS